MAETPLVPGVGDTVYLVFADFGQFGRAYVETAEDEADRETIIRKLVTAQYDKPLRIVAFNTAEGWARDVTREIAQEAARRREDQSEDISGLLSLTVAPT